MSIIQLNHVTFSFAHQTQPLFQDVNLNLDTSWRLGLVGRNGYGKTTFLRLLQGDLQPDNGQIVHQIHWQYFPQPVADVSAITFYALAEMENFAQWEIERELRLLQVDPAVLWQPFETLSGGEQTKVRLALLFLATDGFALIDEPTNHLDQKSRQLVADYLKEKTGFIVVSHDRQFLNQVIDHVLAIEKATVMLHQGNFALYEREKQLRDDYENQQNAQLKRDITRLSATAQEKSSWSSSREKEKSTSADKGFTGARAARMMKKAKNLEKRMNAEITEKQTLLKNIETTTELHLNFQPDYHELLLSATDVQADVDGQPLIEPVSFDLKQGERLVIRGENGIGKSVLLNAIITGDSVQRYTKQISLIKQQDAQLHGTLSDYAQRYRISFEDLFRQLRQLGVGRDVLTQPIETMSAGQQKRVALARSLVEPAALYIWDEPLNYLDVFNIEQITQLLVQTKAPMIIVEHDELFTQTIGTKFLDLRRAE